MFFWKSHPPKPRVKSIVLRCPATKLGAECWTRKVTNESGAHILAGSTRHTKAAARMFTER